MEKQKKALYFAPLLVIPILILLFHAFGGGTASNQKKQATGVTLDASLPAPYKKNLPESKWEAYQMASLDQQQEKEKRQKDKYFFPRSEKKDSSKSTTISRVEQEQLKGSNEEEELRKQLQAYMQEEQEGKKKADLSLASNKTTKKELAQKGRINNFSAPIEKPAPVAKPKNRFYSIGEKKETNQQNKSNTITAVIHQNQTVSNGSVVKIRLLEEMISTDGTTIPKNSFVFGKATLSDKRLNVNIYSTVLKQKIHTVSLTVFDTDGMEGINIPGSMARERTEDALAEATSAAPTGLEAVSPGIISATASAAVGAVKSLVRGKVKEEKVHLKAGYKILLTNK